MGGGALGLAGYADQTRPAQPCAVLWAIQGDPP